MTAARAVPSAVIVSASMCQGSVPALPPWSRFRRLSTYVRPMALRDYLSRVPWRLCRCEGGEQPLCVAGSGCAGRLDFDARRRARALAEGGPDPAYCACGHHADAHWLPGMACGSYGCACGRLELPAAGDL